MTQQDALELVLSAARQNAQIRSDDPDVSDEEQAETETLWEAIELLAQSDECRDALKTIAEGGLEAHECFAIARRTLDGGQS